MERFIIISGCSGGGKSTLLTELGRRGHSVVEEPGRRIIGEEQRTGGSALPWEDPVAFARRAMNMAIEDRRSAAALSGWVFFDRGLIDAAAQLQHLTGEPALATLAGEHRYCRTVFLAPPWPEIYVNDPERRHGMEIAEAEYSRLLHIYPTLGYDACILPKVSVTERADFVENALAKVHSPGACNDGSTASRR